MSEPALGPKLVAVFGLLTGLLCAACPEAQRTKHAAEPCSKAYEKCELSPGLLGVCDVVECAEGHAPPCLTCRSQH